MPRTGKRRARRQFRPIARTVTNNAATAIAKTVTPWADRGACRSTSGAGAKFSTAR